MSSRKSLVLVFKGYDNWDRPVYECDGILYVDVDPRKNMQPDVYTKIDNKFYGEPDIPVADEHDIVFIPRRKTWSW